MRAHPFNGVGDDEGGDQVPSHFVLNQNHPNPFNPSTTIKYGLPKPAYVQVIIYNLLGQKVETLVDGHKISGHHTVTWDASNFSSGIYFYKLTAGDFTQTKRMTLLK